LEHLTLVVVVVVVVALRFFGHGAEDLLETVSETVSDFEFPVIQM
jgi:hypothetical protein